MDKLPIQQEEKPKKKKTWHKRWTPKQFALYLMSVDIKYVLPGTSNETIMEEVPKLHCGIGKVSNLRNHKEFQDTVEEHFNFKIRSKFSTETMFWCYLRHSFEANMNKDDPSSKLMDVLGYVSGEYAPRKPKGKPGKKMTPAQVARLIHQREQIQSKLDEKEGLNVNGKEDENGK